MTLHYQNHRFRHLAIRAALITFVGCSMAWASVADGDAPTISRVRSGDSSILALIHRAAQQSATFKKLVRAIESSDGIVYVEPGACGHGARACLKMWMSLRRGNRFLCVLADRQRADSDEDFMGSIGHELQHAIEALSEPANTDGVKLYNFFRRTAPTDNNRFETAAAINAGDAVRVELRAR